jgi:hypothetical protein
VLIVVGIVLLRTHEPFVGANPSEQTVVLVVGRVTTRLHEPFTGRLPSEQ